jgi:hypothetical protein
MLIFSSPIIYTYRWFRFDETYSYNRRVALQEYLRILVKTVVLRRWSQTLASFLDPPSCLGNILVDFCISEAAAKQQRLLDQGEAVDGDVTPAIAFDNSASSSPAGENLTMDQYENRDSFDADLLSQALGTSTGYMNEKKYREPPVSEADITATFDDIDING